MQSILGGLHVAGGLHFKMISPTNPNSQLNVATGYSGENIL